MTLERDEERVGAERAENMETTQQAGPASFWGGAFSRLDGWARRVDKWIGGVETLPAFHRRSLLAFLLPLPVYLFAIYGPAVLSAGGGPLWRGAWPFVLLLASIAGQLVYFLSHAKRWLRRLHVALVSACAVGSWLLADPTSRENTDLLYRHGYGLAACLALLSAGVIAPLLAARPVFTMPDDAQAAFRAAFDGPRVLAAPAPLPVTRADLTRAAITAVTTRPLHILVPVAGVALVAPTSLLWEFTLGALVFVFACAVMANYDPARDAIVRFIARTLLSGSAALVSLIVVALAVCRLAALSYVSTILDASSAWTVLSYLFAAYSLIWLHDFWIHQSAIDALGDSAQQAAMKSSRPGAMGALSAIAPEEVEVVRHGEGRVLVRLRDRPETFRVFEPAALLRRIAHTSPNDRERLELFAARSQARMTAFAACNNALFALLIAAWWLAAQHTTKELPALADGAGTFDLGARLVATRASPEPVILVAASGGGTRAALYTSAVLHGIQRAGHLPQIAAASSVSGGSAAIAYFASYHAALSTGDERAWKQMRDALAKPFIEDVLAGAFEWRILGRGYLGELLTESFEKHFWGGVPRADYRTTLGQVSELGLIFNTGVCGAAELGKSPSSSDGGGFAILTNVSSTFVHAMARDLGWPERLPLKRVAQPALTLTRAAAISANFPPVFSNVPLDVQEGERLWLTDGGAVENRGIIPLLAALSESIAKLDAATPLRPVRIVVAEASALDGDYRTDRGIGAKFGAATQLANGYVTEQLMHLDAQLAAHQSSLRVVYLPMPDALRAAGTFGTHWMMPPRVPLGAPSGSPVDELLEVESERVIELVDSLFREDAVAQIHRTFPADDVQVIRRLELAQRSLWTRLVDGLRAE